MIYKGLKVGMLLQLAIGPITLVILQISLSSGYASGVMGVLGVTLGDALYVVAAILGVGTMINQSPQGKKYLGAIGALVMVIFGGLMIMESLGLSLFPMFQLTSSQGEGAFIKVFLLTIANPMTIIFWAGVFAAKMVEEEMHRKDMYLFGLGAVSSTLMFQLLIVLMSGNLGQYITPSLMTGLNLLVGLILFYGGVQLFIKNKEVAKIEPSSNEL